jgi:hypothetical protein
MTFCLIIVSKLDTRSASCHRSKATSSNFCFIEENFCFAHFCGSSQCFTWMEKCSRMRRKTIFLHKTVNERRKRNSVNDVARELNCCENFNNKRRFLKIKFFYDYFSVERRILLCVLARKCFLCCLLSIKRASSRWKHLKGGKKLSPFEQRARTGDGKIRGGMELTFANG